MWPYCIRTIDFIEQLLESLSCGGCSTPPPASSSTTVFYKFVCVCVCVRVCGRERVCVSHTRKLSRNLSRNQEIWRKLVIWEKWIAILWLLLCSDSCCPLTLPTADGERKRERKRGGKREGEKEIIRASIGPRAPSRACISPQQSMHWPTHQHMHWPTRRCRPGRCVNANFMCDSSSRLG